jgi:calcineurin-like phosphoesterase family protein
MVNVLVVADEVASNLQERTLRDLSPDLVLAAGDLPWDYLEWIASSVDSPMVFVPGNHDPEIQRARQGRFDDYLEPGAMCEFPRPHGVVNADQDVVEAAGLRIAGLGGCVRYSRGPHQYTQRQYVRRANRLLRRARTHRPVDVLLTHAPPLGLGDAEDRPHVGIQALHRVIERLEPTWHLHGHIHPYGQTMPDRQVGATTISNVIPWKVLDITPKLSQVVTHPA